MLIGLKNLSLTIGSQAILDHVQLSIHAGDRIALIGRNGTGKTSLLRIISQETQPDAGEIIIQRGCHIRSMLQAVPQGIEGTVYDMVALGLGERAKLLAQYHHLSQQANLDERALSELHEAIDQVDGWQISHRIDALIQQLELPGEARFESLSGGTKRRVMLAQALVSDPDILLLDEPTNHLDIPSIQQLEHLLRGFNGAIIFTSHDRAFIRSVANRICSLDRGKLQSWSCSYDQFIERQQSQLEAERDQQALFDKRLSAEEVWIRRGVEARRTRNQGRVARLLDMRQAYAQRRQEIGQAKLTIEQAELGAKLVIDADQIEFNIGHCKVRPFSSIVLRGDKIAILGRNGIGKTTLIRTLLGELPIQSGQLKLGKSLKIAYFDQLRQHLNDQETAVDVIGLGKDYIRINDQDKHVMSYLQDFLFTPERARQPIATFSGGERARLLLARLFSQASNLMILDEPTNDLDIETLELLEEQLEQYSGTLLVVSHDREFIDQFATRCWVFEPQGNDELSIADYVGGYSDWLRQRRMDPWLQPLESSGPTPPLHHDRMTEPAAASIPATASPTKAVIKKKLSYKEQRELDELPGLIEALEQRYQADIEATNQADFFKQPGDVIAKKQMEVQALGERIQQLYDRWSALTDSP